MTFYGALTHQGKNWRITGLAPHVAIRLKQLFPKISKAQVGEFTFSDSPESCADLAWFLHRYDLEMSDADAERLTEGRGQFEKERADLEAILSFEWPPPVRHGFRPGFKPWLIQAQAAEILHRKKALILGDPLGQGKTFSALTALVGSPYLPAAILAKTHLPTQWVNEFITPSTYLSSHIIRGRANYRLPPANIYLFKYSNIAAWSDLAGTGFFRSFVADEVHELRTGVSTEKGKAAKVFADNAEIKMGMSGTPIFNYGDEIFNILDIFSPGLLGDKEEFHREWCVEIKAGKWAVRDPDALGTYLRELQVFLRREREGRPVNTQLIDVDFDDNMVDRDRDLTEMLAMKTLSGRFFEAGQAARDLDARLRLETGLGKARGVAAFCRLLLSQKIPVILFGWHREVYRIWLKELADFNPAMFTGTENAKQKDKSKKAFMDGDTDLVIMSLRSGDGTDGLQHRCSTVVFGEYDWSPGVHAQGIGRVDRPYQLKEIIDAYYCHVDWGSDPTLVSMHGLKSSQARGIIQPLAGVQHVFKDEQRVKMLAQNYLAQRHKENA